MTRPTGKDDAIGCRRARRRDRGHKSPESLVQVAGPSSSFARQSCSFAVGFHGGALAKGVRPPLMSERNFSVTQWRGRRGTYEALH
jgi:hypothetical protein